MTYKNRMPEDADDVVERRDRLRLAQRRLSVATPPYMHGTDNRRFYTMCAAVRRVQEHLSDNGWGVRLVRRSEKRA